jgi:UPF0716 family protein affecting phage T7 exclusion
LLTPGFLTDIVGLALIFPPTRAPVKAIILARVARRAKSRFGVDPQPRVQEAKVVKVEKTERPKTTSDPAASQLPSAGRPDGEDGSPGTR